MRSAIAKQGDEQQSGGGDPSQASGGSTERSCDTIPPEACPLKTFQQGLQFLPGLHAAPAADLVLLANYLRSFGIIEGPLDFTFAICTKQEAIR